MSGIENARREARAKKLEREEAKTRRRRNLDLIFRMKDPSVEKLLHARRGLFSVCRNVNGNMTITGGAFHLLPYCI